MKQDVAQKWVEALRSGKYPQGTRSLRNGGQFCCLGVLCDISGIGSWHVGAYRVGPGCLSTAYLPEPVAEYAGWKYPSTQHELADRNDAGASFAEIADYIEANWEAL